METKNKSEFKDVGATKFKDIEITKKTENAMISSEYLLTVFKEVLQLKKFSANAPTYYPKNFFEQIYFYHNGADYRVYFWVDNAWKYTALT